MAELEYTLPGTVAVLHVPTALVQQLPPDAEAPLVIPFVMQLPDVQPVPVYCSRRGQNHLVAQVMGVVCCLSSVKQPAAVGHASAVRHLACTTGWLGRGQACAQPDVRGPHQDAASARPNFHPHLEAQQW